MYLAQRTVITLDQLSNFTTSPPAQDLALIPFLPDDLNDQHLSSESSSASSDSDNDSDRDPSTGSEKMYPKFPLKLKPGRTRRRRNVGIEELSGER